MSFILSNEDCFIEFKNIANESIDLIVVDPPYRMTKRGKSCRPNWMPSNMGDNLFNGSIPDPSQWLSECFRVLKYDTHMYVFTNTIMLQEILNAATESGFKLHNLITMIKDTGMPNRWYYKQCELILFFRKGKAKPINDMTSRDWISVEMPKASTGKVHITQKPLDLIVKLVSNSSKIGDVVLDPFMGSGTTGVACAMLGRDFIGIELDEGYCEHAKNRINQALDNKGDI